MEEEWVKNSKYLYEKMPYCMGISAEMERLIMRTKEYYEQMLEDKDKIDILLPLIEENMRQIRQYIKDSRYKCGVPLDSKIKEKIDGIITRKDALYNDVVLMGNIIDLYDLSKSISKTLIEKYRERRK